MPLHPYQRLSEAERQLRKAAEDLKNETLRRLADDVANERRSLAEAMKAPPAPPKPQKKKPHYVDAMDRRAPGHYGAKEGG